MGKGFATKSARACLDYAFNELGLNRILGRTMKGNAASVKVLEKIGLKFEKEMEWELHIGVLYKLRKS